MPQVQLARDPTVGIDHHRPDDRFLPVSVPDLMQTIAGDRGAFGALAPGFLPVGEALRDVLTLEADRFERELVDLYEPFNPDRETFVLADLSAVRTPARYAELSVWLGYLLEKANFDRLDEIQIDAAVRAARTHGLRVRLRPELIQELTVWVRGTTTVERRQPTWQKPLAGELRRIPVYRRLVVLARLRDDPNVVIKMFKEIPIEDVEALLPHAEVQMNWKDRLMLVGSGGWLVGSTASKLMNVLFTAAYLSRIFWVLAFGVGMLTVRTFTGYRTARTKRDWQRTRHLYYQNVNNNVSTIHTLVSNVAREDLKEALLAYVLCAVAPPADAAELDRRIEGYVRGRFGVKFNFDLRDAIETLDRLELWDDRAAWRVLPAEIACQKLTDRLRDGSPCDYHLRRLRQPAACGGTEARAAGAVLSQPVMVDSDASARSAT